METCLCTSEEQLIALGTRIASQLKGGDVVLLNGELGAGKTTFVKGLALGLGITTAITSPTYTISKEYGNILCHVDAYRVGSEDLGIDDYIAKEYVVCIEWGENLGEFIPLANYIVDIDYHLQGRKVVISTVN